MQNLFKPDLEASKKSKKKPALPKEAIQRKSKPEKKKKKVKVEEKRCS